MHYKLHVQPYLQLKSEYRLLKLELESVFGEKIHLDEPFSSVAIDSNEVDEGRLRELAFVKEIEADANSGRKTLILDAAYFEASAQFSQVKRMDVYDKSIKENHSRAKESHYLTHGLHEYKGKFYPQIVRALLVCSKVKKEATVLDPFCGSGTTLVEASLMGHNSLGIEINPLGCFMSRVKVNTLTIDADSLENDWYELASNLYESYKLVKQEAETGEEIFVDLMKRAQAYSPPNLDSWFARGVLLKLIAVKLAILDLPPGNHRDLFLLCLSDIVKPVSNWAPGQVRVRLRKWPRADADVIGRFREKVVETLAMVRQFNLLKHALNIQLGRAQVLDASIDEANLPKESFDIVLTSPPYASALPYIDTLRLPTLFLGLATWNELKHLFTREIGNREISRQEREALLDDFLRHPSRYRLPDGAKSLIRQLASRNRKLPETNFRRKDMPAALLRYFLAMSKSLDGIISALMRGGRAILIVGNNRVRSGDRWLEVETDQFLSQMCRDKGLSLVEIIPKELAHTTSPRKIHQESVLIFEKDH